MTALLQVLEHLEQGTAEWLALRKTKITATDAAVIMGASPYKTRLELYHEKLSDEPPKPPNERMKRGTDLEPVARDLFILKSGMTMHPVVLVNDWTMASLDGISQCGNFVLEIKCPGKKDHDVALSGKIPDHYYPQLQHQMYVSGVQLAYYFSFDGFDGVTVEVKRDDEYIERMITEEFKFYMHLQQKTPPPPIGDEYTERNDELWQECALKWKSLSQRIKILEAEEEEARKQLIFLSGESNTKGAGISLCKVVRKGTVDYPKMIKKMDIADSVVEEFRKPSSTSWRLT